MPAVALSVRREFDTEDHGLIVQIEVDCWEVDKSSFMKVDVHALVCLEHQWRLDTSLGEGLLGAVLRECLVK